MSDVAELYEETNENSEGTEASNSEKSAKFVELAGKRVTNVLDALRILGNLSNTSTYVYTNEQVEKIFGRIQADLDEVKEKFKPKEKKAKDTSFSL